MACGPYSVEKRTAFGLLVDLLAQQLEVGIVVVGISWVDVVSLVEQELLADYHPRRVAFSSLIQQISLLCPFPLLFHRSRIPTVARLVISFVHQKNLQT